MILFYVALYKVSTLRARVIQLYLVINKMYPIVVPPNLINNYKSHFISLIPIGQVGIDIITTGRLLFLFLHYPYRIRYTIVEGYNYVQEAHYDSIY